MRSPEGNERQVLTLPVINDTIRRGKTRLEGTHDRGEIGLREVGCRAGKEVEA